MVILFSKAQRKTGERLQRIIEGVIAKKDVKICRTIDSLSMELHQPRNDINVAILVASSRSDLHELVSLRDLLWDMKIILILPDSDPNIVAKGHILRPRFLSDCNSNFQDVAAVLSRMINNSDINKKPMTIPEGEKSMKRLSHCGLQSPNIQSG